jgi:hypothetical protein
LIVPAQGFRLGSRFLETVNRVTAIAILVALGLAAGATAAAPPREVAAATRIASKLSGLSVKHPVEVRFVTAKQMAKQAQRLLDRDDPSRQQAYDQTVYRALGLLAPTQRLRPALLAVATANVPALYDARSAVLYVRTGSSRRAALLRGLVHALEDQAFGLRRMSRLRSRDRDAALAAAAAVDGDASFASSLLGSPKVSGPAATGKLPGTRIGDFLTLEQDFPATVGRRFATTLHNLGGNKAIFTALRRFPTTTAQIFHIDAFLMREPALPVTLPQSAAGFTLQRSDTFGELDVRALLAVYQVPRLDAAAEGWRGGRSAVYADSSGASAVAIALTWDTEADAQQWADAAATYVNEAFDAGAPGAPPTTSCGDGVTCWQLSDRSVAFAESGERTALAVAPTASSAAAIAAATDGGSF